MTRAEALAAFVARSLPLREGRAVLRTLDEARALGKSDALRAAMATETKVAFSYARKYDGQTVDVVARPYEVKPHPTSGRRVLYAQDARHGGQIHSFLWSRIGEVTNLTRAAYQPHWPTLPESV